MGILGKIAKNKVTGIFRKAEKPVEVEQLPLGLHIGGVLTIDELDFKLIGARTNMTFPDDMATMVIKAYGKIVLDPQTTIHRFYTDADGYFFQVTEENDEVVELLFFAPHDTVYPANEEDWELWKEELIGDETFETRDGEVYNRAMSEDYEGMIDAFEFEEHMTEGDGDTFIIEHTMMLYARYVDEVDDTIEWLYVGVEDTGETAEVALYLGMNVDETMIEIT